MDAEDHLGPPEEPPGQAGSFPGLSPCNSLRFLGQRCASNEAGTAVAGDGTVRGDGVALGPSVAIWFCGDPQCA